eukprot:CAMPEP_0168793308 /NCGR_PEP_ID=MMETSP0725-20121227/15015_1 /TAXON_ID=265536 /ORGANISM="Amphiprora sp., Strain CCMP467" /LENGTH=162 /DNA_ID=CAMNT_0008844073 /DNA_START=210 /DNA_END=698 /DNA_ORIENTATION=+
MASSSCCRYPISAFSAKLRAPSKLAIDKVPLSLPSAFSSSRGKFPSSVGATTVSGPLPFSTPCPLVACSKNGTNPAEDSSSSVSSSVIVDSFSLKVDDAVSFSSEDFVASFDDELLGDGSSTFFGDDDNPVSIITPPCLLVEILMPGEASSSFLSFEKPSRL